MTIKPLLIILTIGALTAGAQAVIVSTADKDGDFMSAANWGGVDPKSKPDDTYIISAGHTLALKVSGRTAAFPVKSVVISKGAVLNMSSSTLFDCSGKTLVLDGGELNMGGGSLNQMILDIRADSTVRIGGAGFGGGQVIGKGVLEFVRGGGKKVMSIDLNDLDFTRYAGKILIGKRMEGPGIITLSGKSRNMGPVPIELNPHARCSCTLNLPDGINMAGPINIGGWASLKLGNTSCTLGDGSTFPGIIKNDQLPSGVYTPATTSNYTQIPTLKGRSYNLQAILEPSSIDGSSIIILPPAGKKSANRIDAGATFTLKEAITNFASPASELCLNGGTLQSSGPHTITGSIQVLNHSVLDFDVPKANLQSALCFAKGRLTGSGNVILSGKGGVLVFDKDFKMQDYDGKITTENLQGAAELVFGSGGWGAATLVLNSKVPVIVSGGGAPLQTLGTFILDGDKARLDMQKSAVTVGAGCRVGDKEICPGVYTAANTNGFKAVPVSWLESVSKSKGKILRAGTVDLSQFLVNSNSATLAVVDFKRVKSTAKTGSITSPASWGGLNPSQLTAAQYEIAAGHVLSTGPDKWDARELAIGKGGVLSMDGGNLDLGGRNLFLHQGILSQEIQAPRVINGNLVVFDDHYLKDEYSGTLLLNGGDLTVKGTVVGSRNKQSTLVIRRTKPGAVKLIIDGQMGSVPPTGIGYDITVNDFAGNLDFVWSQGLLNEGYIEFAPKSGTIGSAAGFNSPRGTLRLPANPQVKLDLKNASNTLMIGTTIGGVFIERGDWTEEKTAGFTKVPECNTSRIVDLTPYLLNTKGASLKISNPGVGVDAEEEFDSDQIYVPEIAFNPQTLKQLKEHTEKWVAPFRTALATKTSYHKVTGEKFTHADYMWGALPKTVFSLFTAYKILGDDPEVLAKMMIVADYFQQLITMDPLATGSIYEQQAGEPCPAEAATCASYMSLTLSAMQIWEKEYKHPGSVDKQLLAKADAYLDFAWNQNAPANPKVGLKKWICPDGKVDPATGVPLFAINRGKFTWNSDSGIWQAQAPMLEAIRFRKLATGKTDWDQVYDVASKGLTWYMDFFFRDSSCGEIDGKKYVWWTYNTIPPGGPGFQGTGPGWKDGLYKGMKIILGGEDSGHIGADLLGFSWIWSMRHNAYGLTDERLERIANGSFYGIGNSQFGGLGGMFNPYRIELGDPIPGGGGPNTNQNYAKLTVFKIPRSYRNIVLNRVTGPMGLSPDWLWIKWIYQNRDNAGRGDTKK